MLVSALRLRAPDLRRIVEGSLELGAEPPAALPMQRFRPNLVVDGDEPFAEDRWTAVEIGAVRFRVAKPTWSPRRRGPSAWVTSSPSESDEPCPCIVQVHENAVEGSRLVAELHFFTGTMDSGKSTLALQTNHNHAARGRVGRIFTTHDRSGHAVVTSRLGLTHDALEVGADFDVWRYVVNTLTAGGRVDYLV